MYNIYVYIGIIYLYICEVDNIYIDMYTYIYIMYNMYLCILCAFMYYIYTCNMLVEISRHYITCIILQRAAPAT